MVCLGLRGLRYRDSLGEFSNPSYGVFGAERVKVYRDSLGEFSNPSYGVFGAERVKVYRDSLGEFSNPSYGMFGAERVKNLELLVWGIRTSTCTCTKIMCSLKCCN